jgi:hypothetical protein
MTTNNNIKYKIAMIVFKDEDGITVEVGDRKGKGVEIKDAMDWIQKITGVKLEIKKEMKGD